MAYGTKYIIEYKRRSGISTIIYIQENGYSGATTELDTQVIPLEIIIDGDVDNIYKSTLGSGARINILGTALTLTEFFTIDPQKYRVLIYNNETLIWQGFISTGIYSEDYSSSGIVPITLICNDGMSILENILYEEDDGSPFTGFIQITTILNNILDKIDLDFTSLRTSSDLIIGGSSTNIFEDLMIANENFYDEKQEPMNCREVLDSLFSSLGLVVSFRDDTIFFIDPINLHTPALGKTYDVDGTGESGLNLGETIDISNDDIEYYETGQNMDIVQPYNQVVVNYNPYNLLSMMYDFNYKLNRTHQGSEFETIGVDGNYFTSTSTGYTGWNFTDSFPVYGMKENEEDDFLWFIKSDATGSDFGGTTATYTFPLSNINQGGYGLSFNFDMYINTKNANNWLYYTGSTGNTVNQLTINATLKVGNEYYLGDNNWSTTGGVFPIVIRERDSEITTEEYTYSTGWLFKLVNYGTRDVDSSVINDKWIGVSGFIDMDNPISAQAYTGNFLYGDINFTFRSEINTDDNALPDEVVIHNVLFKNPQFTTTSKNTAPLMNIGYENSYKLISGNTTTKKPISIDLTSGIGDYECSRGAFSSGHTITANLDGLRRDGDATLYDTTDLVAQNLISQYNSPRTKLDLNLDVTDYLLNIRNVLIQDTDYLSTKTFYISSGTYYDQQENFKGTMIELVDSRETII